MVVSMVVMTTSSSDRLLQRGGLSPGRDCEETSKYAAQEGRPHHLERLPSRDGAAGQPLGQLVEGVLLLLGGSPSLADPSSSVVLD
jgi:hypothetical protein